MSDSKSVQGSSSSIRDEKASASDEHVQHVHADLRELDVGLRFVAGHSEDPEVSPQESKRIRRKIDRHLLPLLALIYTVQFIDKGTLASSSILGFLTDNKLTTQEFNTLSSAFYIGYLVFIWPQNWALQKLPVGKWLTFNILAWAFFLGMHALAHNFGSFFILRFLLGACEGSMTAGLMLVCSMFYTRWEIGQRLGWVFQCNGIAVVISSFLQFGMVHITIEAGKPKQWQWLMIITAILTFVIFVLFLLFFPDNPTTASFLAPEEKVTAVRRVQTNQNGIETKVWKSYQVREALADPKTWLFAFLAGFGCLIGGIGVEYSLVIKNFGFDTLQTSLLSIPLGVSQIVGIFSASYAFRWFPNRRTEIAVIGWIPSIVGCIIELASPLSNKTARLIGLYLMYLGSSPAFIMYMSWVTATVSGHTKKTTTSAIFLLGYSLGQILSTQFWRSIYAPGYHIPFGITLMAFLMCEILTVVLHFVLKRENRRRDQLKEEAVRTGVGLEKFEEYAIVDTTDEEGKAIKTKVDKTFLDMTDRENLAFRYVL